MPSPSPVPARRRKIERAIARSSSLRPPYAPSASRATAPWTPPLDRYAASVSRPTARACHSSSSAVDSKGRDAGFVAQFGQQRLGQVGLHTEPDALRRTLDDRRSSAWVNGPTSTWLVPTSRASARVGRAVAVVVGPHGDDDLEVVALGGHAGR